MNIIPDEIISDKIYYFRNKKVMLDRDLAKLYNIETKVLKQAVRRKISRFPEDFMFQMTDKEFNDWRSQIVTSNSDKLGLRYPPFCFTEHGIVMLASVLNSEIAIQVNIRIVRVFTRLRDIFFNNKSLEHDLYKIKSQLLNHDKQIILIFNYLEKLKNSKKKEIDFKNRKQIGYQ